MVARTGTAALKEPDEAFFEVGTCWDDGSEGVGPDDRDALVSLLGWEFELDWTILTLGGLDETYDEGGVLFVISVREHHHRVDNLNARVRIDVHALSS